MKNQYLKSWKPVLPGLAAFILLAGILIFPHEAYQSALSGLNIFLQSVFPALLPFFIASEVFVGLGMVDFLSVLLNPVMGPVFRCPGSSSFIWIMSMTSGYPAGARITALFLKQKRITAYEAQRILSFSSTSGPLFIIGAVAIGMMGTVEGGTIILISHYSAAFLLGLVFRFYRSFGYQYEKHRTGLGQALAALTNTRKKDKRPIGQVVGDAVRNSVHILLVIGGFIILFSVIIDLLLHIRIIDWIASIAAVPLKWLSIEKSLLKAVTAGLFEVTTGCKLISRSAVTLQAKLAASSFLIGWSGLSIHAQTASLLTGTGVRFRIYLLGKFLHGLLSAIIAYALTGLFYPKALEAWIPPYVCDSYPEWQKIFMNTGRLLALALTLLAIIIITVSVWNLLYLKKKQL